MDKQKESLEDIFKEIIICGTVFGDEKREKPKMCFLPSAIAVCVNVGTVL